MSILDVKNLCLGFNTNLGFRQALFNVSFSLEKGRTTALVGESGCGKTISAMSILQLLPKNAKITSGEITYEGENLLTISAAEKIRGSKIALIPQDPMTALNPLFTVGEQLIEVIKLHQGIYGDAAWKIAKEAFDEVQIPAASERLKSYPHEFSGGMKQRAIIAMALACKAEVLIADEPTTALDVTIQAQIMDLIRQIKLERQTSILLITHDLALVCENSDDVCVMYSGKIVEQAPSNIFFKDPKHPYSIALLNSLPTNRGRSLETITGQPPSIYHDIAGCRFNPRCKHVMDICRIQYPEYNEIYQSHFCACHLLSDN